MSLPATIVHVAGAEHSPDGHIQRCRDCGDLLADLRPYIRGEGGGWYIAPPDGSPLIADSAGPIAPVRIFPHREGTPIEKGPGYSAIVSGPITATLERLCRATDELLDELTYRSYAANRQRSPEIAPARWGQLPCYANHPRLEARYQQALTAAVRGDEAQAVAP